MKVLLIFKEKTIQTYVNIWLGETFYGNDLDE